MGLGDNPSTMECGDQEKGPADEKGVQHISNELDSVVETMKANIKKAIEREDKAVEMGKKTDELLKAAHGFQKTVQKVERSYWWKNVKIIMVITVTVIIIVLIIILLATGVIPIGNQVPAPPIIKPPTKP